MYYTQPNGRSYKCTAIKVSPSNKSFSVLSLRYQIVTHRFSRQERAFFLQNVPTSYSWEKLWKIILADLVIISVAGKREKFPQDLSF